MSVIICRGKRKHCKEIPSEYHLIYTPSLSKYTIYHSHLFSMKSCVTLHSYCLSYLWQRHQIQSLLVRQLRFHIFYLHPRLDYSRWLTIQIVVPERKKFLWNLYSHYLSTTSKTHAIHRCHIPHLPPGLRELIHHVHCLDDICCWWCSIPTPTPENGDAPGHSDK